MALDTDSSRMESEKPDSEGNKPNIRYWVSQIAAAKNAAKKNWDITKRAWDEYLNASADTEMLGISTAVRARYPIYWSSVRTVQPAIYSRTPILVAEKAFDNRTDEIARLAALAIERLGTYIIRSNPFDRVMYASRDTFLHSGKATIRVYFSTDEEKTLERKYYHLGPTGEWIDETGAPASTELKQDEWGVYAEVEMTKPTFNLELLPLHHQDILHSPMARHWEEIGWIAYRVALTRQEAVDRFGEDLAGKLSFSTDEKKKDKSGSDSIGTPMANIWEIWDKRKKSVYWMCEGYDDEFLDIKEDPYKLAGFFPSPPFILGNIGPDSLYTVPDFAQLEHSIKQLHALSERFQRLVRAYKKRGLANGMFADSLQALNDEADDSEFLFIDDFQKLVGERGLEEIVWFFPTEEFAKAIQLIAQVIQDYEQKFYEIYGVPDVLRGASDPRETAAAQQLKGKFTSLRFSSIQREFQRFVRDAIEQAIDIALHLIPEDELAGIIGVRFWQPQEQAAWPEVLQLLQNDRDREVRIEIETDSTITMNMNAEIEQRNYLAKTVFEGLAAVAQAGAQNPAYSQAAIQLLLYVVRGLQKGKEIESTIEQISQALMQPQPQRPDPEMLKVQGKMQVEQMQAQSDMAVASAKAQADIARENAKAQNAMQVESMRVSGEMQLKQMEAQIAKLQADLQMILAQQKQQHDFAMKERDAAIKASSKQAESAFTTAPPAGDTMIVVGK